MNTRKKVIAVYVLKRIRLPFMLGPQKTNIYLTVYEMALGRDRNTNDCMLLYVLFLKLDPLIKEYTTRLQGRIALSDYK